MNLDKFCMLKVQDCDEVNSIFEAVLAQMDEVPQQFKAVDFRRLVAKHALANKEHTSVSPLIYFKSIVYLVSYCLFVQLWPASATPLNSHTPFLTDPAQKQD